VALQPLLVFIVVTCCFAYAAWTLLPQAARRTLSKRLLRLPLPGSLRLNLERAAGAATGCHCSGCDLGLPKRQLQQKAAPNSEQPLLFHPRKSQ